MEKPNKKSPQSSAVDASRRRLTQAGLVAPAVFGMLASRSVLGNTPYQCTISGQISGNASPNGPDTGEACSLGVSYSTWTSGLDFNKYPGNETLIALNSSLADVYYAEKVGSTTLIIKKPTPASSSDKQATLFEILNGTEGSSPPPQLTYGKKALLLWHNAKTLNPSGGTYGLYPLSESEAVSLFNALVNGTQFLGSTSLGNFSWDEMRIKQYIDLLYH